MKIAIAGGSGLIGRHLVHALLREDHEVVILSRNPDRVRGALPERVRVVGWDPTGLDLDWALELANTAAVVNLCAAPRRGPIESLVDAAASLPAPDRPRAFVSASSIEIYAESARARLWVEQEAAALTAEQLAVRVVLLRTAVVIAPAAPALTRLSLPFRLFVGGPIGSSEDWVSWICIDDMVSLTVRAIGSWDICGPLNLVAPQPVRPREFAAALGRTLGRPNWLPMPEWAPRLVLGERATLVLGRRRLWPAKALAASFVFSHPDLQSTLDRALRPRRVQRAEDTHVNAAAGPSARRSPGLPRR